MEQKDRTRPPQTSVLGIVWIVRIPCRLFTYLFQFWRKFFPWARLPTPAGTPTSQESLDRPVRHARKRLGTVARVVLAFAPLKFRRAFGYPTVLEQDSVPKEMLESPVRPSGKGTKRKQDDATLEEQLSWAQQLQMELPDEDDPEDPTYEATDVETDSEEYTSQNDTDVNVEVEEKDGYLMLKEEPTQQEEPRKEGDAPRGAVGETLDPRCSGDGSEQPDKAEPESDGETLGAKIPSPDPESATSLPTHDPTAELTSSDNSQDQWVNLSGETSAAPEQG